MRFNRTAIAVSILGWAVLAALVLLNLQASPGPLSAVHAREEALSGPDSCEACHGTGSGPAAMAPACGTCHAEIAAQVARKTGFHGTILAAPPSECGRCHAEHLGPDFRPVNPRSFHLAGIADPDRYDHARLGFRLHGAHATLACAACHAAADAPMLDRGGKRFLGLDQRCTSCHADAHRGAFGADCESCHGQEVAFDRAQLYRHAPDFPLIGAHAEAACSACHEPASSRSVARLMDPSSRRNPPPVRSCSDCHASPHSAAFVERAARERSSSVGQSCGACHDPSDRTFQHPIARMTARDHAGTGFLLAPPHDRAACDGCHAGIAGRPPVKASPDPALEFRRRFPGRAPDSCRTCHGDPHGGQFDVGRFAGKPCLACHQPLAFLPSRLDARAHDETAFALRGKHRRTGCSSCHQRPPGKTPDAPPEPVRFRGTPAACSACHADPHEGQFARGVFRGRDCDACHREDSFRPPEFSPKTHELTLFPLSGQHDAVACNACHAAPRDAKGVHARVFVGTPRDCAACHADVHGGRFSGPGVPPKVGDQTGCARCHTTEGFRTISKAFDHATWTGHALKGSHLRLACDSCHVRAGKPDATGRTFGRAAGRRCQDCHADPHVAQFGPPDRVDCLRCHKEERTFKDLAFDHRRDSRFPLDERHAKLACAACHRTVELPGGTRAVRYKPLGVLCGDCHLPRGPEGAKE